MRADDTTTRELVSDRTVRRYGVTAVLVVFTLFSLAVGIGSLLDQWRYQGDSHVAEGTILSIRVKERRWRRERPKSTTVTYEFKTEDGRVLRGTDLISPPTGRQLHEGGPVAIHYLVGDPTANQIYEADEERLYVLWVGMGLGALALCLVWERWLRSREARNRSPALTA